MGAVYTAEIGSSEASESLIPFSEASQADQEKNVSTLYPATGHFEPSFTSTYNYTRSGTNRPTGTDCLTPLKSTACIAKDEDHRNKTTRRIRKHCSDPRCRSCNPYLANRVAKRIVRRINHGLVYYVAEGKNLGRARHDVLSPPQDRYNIAKLEKDGFSKLFKEGIAILERYCTKGTDLMGVVEVHAERKKHEDDGTECNKKKCRRKHTWVEGVHLHFQGYGWFEQGDKIYRETGWIFKGVADKGERDLYATVGYQLTHHAVLEKSNGRLLHGYRYVGLIAPHRSKMVRVGSAIESVLCTDPKCGAVQHLFPQHIASKEEGVPDHFCFSERVDYEMDLGEARFSTPLYEFRPKGPNDPGRKRGEWQLGHKRSRPDLYDQHA